jgi:D-alanine-D-alanine ligase
MTTNKQFDISTAKVAVLMGGRSAERDISLMSGEGVLKALQSKGVNAHAFDPANQAMDQLKQQGFSHAFIALHGRYGEDGSVQGALELLGIPYTGSGVMASSIAMDKVMTKRIWSALGLSTPKSVSLAPDEQSPQAIAAIPQTLGTAADRQTAARRFIHWHYQSHHSCRDRSCHQTGDSVRPRFVVRRIHRW